MNVDWALGSYEDSVPESNSAKLLMGPIGELKQAYKVDLDRCTLWAVPAAYGAWDLITRHPDPLPRRCPCAARSRQRAETVMICRCWFSTGGGPHRSCQRLPRYDGGP